MATIDKTIKHHANVRIRQLRDLLRQRYGARKYRIDLRKRVHVYGVQGWQYIGNVSDVMRDFEM
jgi:hypothetical protein